MRLRVRLAGLLAALGLTATASANDVPVLLPAQPVAPTRTEQMMAADAGFGGDGLTVTAVGPGCAAPCEPGGRRFLDGTYRRTLAGVIHRINTGVAMPLRCSCWAAEHNFFFGGCKSFFTPAWECNACGLLGCGARFTHIHYGPGSRGLAPSCKTPPFTVLPNSQ